MYTTKWCGYCVRAKALLDSRGVEYEEVDLGDDPGFRARLNELTGGWTVPQIVIGAAGVDPRRALREDASLYTALVVFTDFGGCRHMVGALGTVPARFAAAKAQLDRACDSLQLSSTLFTRAVRDSSVGTMGDALDTAQRALAPLDRAQLALRRK